MADMTAKAELLHILDNADWRVPDRPRWIVTVDLPYHPSIEYFGSQEEAYARADKIYDYESKIAGNHKVNVTVAKELSTKVTFPHCR